MAFIVPPVDQIRPRIQDAFGVRPCDFQIRDVVEQLKRKDVVTISPTGSGKSLTFWAPLLFTGNQSSIIITALTIIGDQNVSDLARLGISAVNLNSETASDKLFRVGTLSTKLSW